MEEETHDQSQKERQEIAHGDLIQDGKAGNSSPEQSLIGEENEVNDRQTQIDHDKFQQRLDDARRQGEEKGQSQALTQLRDIILGSIETSNSGTAFKQATLDENRETASRDGDANASMRHPGLAGNARSYLGGTRTRPVGGGRGGGPGAGPNLRQSSYGTQNQGDSDGQANTQSKPSFNGPNRFPGGLELMEEGQPGNFSSHGRSQGMSNAPPSASAPSGVPSTRRESFFASNASNVSIIDPAEAQAVSTFLYRIRLRFKEFFAEFIACVLLVLVGTSVDAQVQLSQKLNPQEQAGSYASQNWAWGLAVMCTIHLAGGISGAHCNPGLTVGLAMFRGFPWRMVWIYLLAQYLGCFCGAGLAYAIYQPAINLYEGHGIRTIVGNHPTGGFFTTVPSNTSTPASAFSNELCASSILGAMVLAIGDDSNSPPGDGMSALILGLTVTMVGMSFGWNSGYPINPARDLGPRVFLSMAGYDSEVWTHNDYWWIYGGQVATYLGTLIGCFLYDLLLYHGTHSPLNSLVNWRWQLFRHKALTSANVTKPIGKGARKAKMTKQQDLHPTSPTMLENQLGEESLETTEASRTKDEIRRGWASLSEKQPKRRD